MLALLLDPVVAPLECCEVRSMGLGFLPGCCGPAGESGKQSQIWSAPPNAVQRSWLCYAPQPRAGSSGSQVEVVVLQKASSLQQCFAALSTA